MLNEMDLKHIAEREVLLRLVEQSAHTEYNRQSHSIDKTGQEVRLNDISDQRRQLRDSAAFDNKEQELLLQVRSHTYIQCLCVHVDPYRDGLNWRCSRDESIEVGNSS